MRREIAISVIFYLIVSFSIVTVKGEETVEPFFTLVLRAGEGENYPDYGLYVAQYLQEINIDLEVKLDSGGFYRFDPYLMDDFDMTLSAFSDLKTHDMRDYYTEEGMFNLFRLDRSIPYQNESETMQNEAISMIDLAERQQTYYDWEILLMDKILPLLPLFSPRQYVATWDNTLGFDLRWGLADSLPYMEYDGLHEGQESLNEFNVADDNWRDLNLLKTDDIASLFIYSLIAEPIVGWSPDLAPLKTSLVVDWEQIDEFHYKFTMRDGVYWNPSYNVTGRNASSESLEVATTPLMNGLKNGEVSTGTNQLVTAKDAVFTYLAWANPIVSENPSYHNWISNVYVDPVDPLAFHIEIDANPETPEIEPYVDFWSSLHQFVLPEFFLNSSDSTISYTSGGVKCTGFYEGIQDSDSWGTASTSAFGCGKYQLDYYIKDSVTVLQASPYWMNFGVIDGTEQDLDLETINVHIIPDSSAELAEFKAGRLDLCDLTPFPAERKTMQADTRFEVQCILSYGFNLLAFNMHRPNIGGSSNLEWINGTELGDYTKACAIRKAICYVIDRGEINQVIHNGEYLMIHEPMFTLHTWRFDSFPIKYHRDLDLAWKWMEAAGYARLEESISLFLPSCLSVILLIIIRKKQKN